MSLAYKMIESPVGELKLVASDKGLVAVLWENDRPGRVRLSELVENEQHPVLLKTERQLNEYFAGKRKEFSVALDMRGTRFQKDVWTALLAIPFGETRSLRPACETAWESSGVASCGRGERKESSVDHCAVPSRDWIIRKTYGLCGRAGYESPFAWSGKEKCIAKAPVNAITQ